MRLYTVHLFKFLGASATYAQVKAQVQKKDRIKVYTRDIQAVRDLLHKREPEDAIRIIKALIPPIQELAQKRKSPEDFAQKRKS